MKKIIFSLMMMAIGTIVQAQSLWDTSKPDERFTFGLKAGVNFASTDTEYANSTRTGFHLGGTVDYNIVKCISLSSGITFTQKGFKSNFGKADAYYLQVPVLAAYHFEAPTGVKFIINAGPYFAYGIGGKVSYMPSDVMFDYDFHQDSFGKRGFFNDFDMGLTAGVYVQIAKVLFGFNYELGLSDMARVYSQYHNRNAAFSVGYQF